MAITRLTSNRPLTGSIGHEDRSVSGRPTSPWLTLESAAAHLGYDMAEPKKAADAMRALARRHRVPMYRRGRRLLFDRQDLDRWLRAQRVA